MASVSTEKKMSLKIFVDVKSSKVVFAEAGKEFVDFIFHLMHLPLSSVTKLLKDKHGMVGCFGSLYKSIESLDAHCYEPNLSKALVLKPRCPTIVPLLSFVDSPETISYYKYNCTCLCKKSFFSDSKSSSCPVCSNSMSTEYSFRSYVPPKDLNKYEAARYVNRAVPYMVMDNLEVKPMSMSLIKSLVRDFDSLEEKIVEFGQHEGLALLKASLEKEDVLTTVFLRKKI